MCTTFSILPKTRCRYENEDSATLLSMKFDNKDDGTYKAGLRAEIGSASSVSESVDTVGRVCNLARAFSSFLFNLATHIIN